MCEQMTLLRKDDNSCLSEGDHQKYAERSYIEINLKNLRHNVAALRKVMNPECELMAVVKADAYGHGSLKIAESLNAMGVRAFAVATIDEAISLRHNGIRGEILVLGYTAPQRAAELQQYHLSQTLIGYEHAKELWGTGIKIKVHLKIDTGMHRLGFLWSDAETISKVFEMHNFELCGMYTHLCVSDSQTEKDVSFTHQQIEHFYNLLDWLRKKNLHIPPIHIQSSYGLLNYPELKCHYVRVGIALYGVLSAPADRTKVEIDLRPVLSLKSTVILIRNVPKGETVGYGRVFTAKRDSIIAIIPIGYADGYPRNLSCRQGSVLINGVKVPIVGKICMDQMTVDITDAKQVLVGAKVTLIGRDGDEEITAPELAAQSGSIANELLSRLGSRLPVILQNEMQ